MRESWTDARLDDFRGEVGRCFDQVETELQMQRLETKAGFESLQRLILQVGGGIIATLVIGVFTVLATG